MSNTLTYIFASALGGAYLLSAAPTIARSLNIIENDKPFEATVQYLHLGKFSSDKGEFQMTQNNMHDETLWEKTKEMGAKAWEATKEGTAKAWDKTKELSGDAWDKTKELSGDTKEAVADKSSDAWEATKDGTDKAWDKTKEVSGDAWEATKDGADKAWDKTKEVSGDAWDKTKEAADKAGDALSGDDYNNPMYNPENSRANEHFHHHSNN